MTQTLLEAQGTATSEMRFIADELLSDGTVLDLVRGETVASQPQLVEWDGTVARFGRNFTRSQIVYAPVRFETAIERSIGLPERTSDYSSVRELFDEVKAAVSRAYRLPDGVVTSLAFFVFSTWLADCLPLAPFLWMNAPYGVPREPLRRILSALCRRALVITEFNLTALSLLPLYLRPTVVTEVDFRSIAEIASRFESARLLRPRARPVARFILRKGNFFAISARRENRGGFAA